VKIDLYTSAVALDKTGDIDSHAICEAALPTS